MAQKVIEIVEASKESFAKAAENGVAEAAKTVRGMRWARVAELEMVLTVRRLSSIGPLRASTSTSNAETVRFSLTRRTP